MSSDLAAAFLWSLVAMASPTLLAVVTVLLLQPNPRRLMLGYLLGAYVASMTFGLLIVFALPDSATSDPTKNKVGPVEDIVVGLLSLALAAMLQRRRRPEYQERHRAEHEAKLAARRAAGKPIEGRPTRLLRRGDPKVTFVVGIALTLPGFAYLSGLSHINKLDAGAGPTVVLVASFCVVQQLFLELPLLGYYVAPERTQVEVSRFRGWITRNGGHVAVLGAQVVGVLLICRGLATLL